MLGVRQLALDGVLEILPQKHGDARGFFCETWSRATFAAAPPDTPALVIDAPLLFEAGVDAECDAVVFVETGRETRGDRLRATRGWDEAETGRREDSQLPLDVKRSRADYVLRNDGDLSALETQVRTVLNSIIETRRT